MRKVLFSENVFKKILNKTGINETSGVSNVVENLSQVIVNEIDIFFKSNSINKLPNTNSTRPSLVYDRDFDLNDEKLLKNYPNINGLAKANTESVNENLYPFKKTIIKVHADIYSFTDKLKADYFKTDNAETSLFSDENNSQEIKGVKISVSVKYLGTKLYRKEAFDLISHELTHSLIILNKLSNPKNKYATKKDLSYKRYNEYQTAAKEILSRKSLPQLNINGIDAKMFDARNIIANIIYFDFDDEILAHTNSIYNTVKQHYIDNRSDSLFKALCSSAGFTKSVEILYMVKALGFINDQAIGNILSDYRKSYAVKNFRERANYISQRLTNQLFKVINYCAVNIFNLNSNIAKITTDSISKSLNEHFEQKYKPIILQRYTQEGIIKKEY